MGFLKNLFGSGPPPEPWPPPGPITTWPVGNKINIQGDATIFDRHPSRYVDVVGESFRQDNLDIFAGGRTRDGAKIADHMALLLREPTNPKDADAVRVFLIPSQGGTAAPIGYLDRSDAVAYRQVIERLAASGRLAMCHASLKGGWDREISFGVMLRIGAPWTLMAQIDRDNGPDPRWQSPIFGDDGRPYSRIDCPSCGVALDPLPKAKKKCPSCGQPIYVRSGPDEIRYLLAESDLAAHDAKWAEPSGDYHR